MQFWFYRQARSLLLLTLCSLAVTACGAGNNTSAELEGQYHFTADEYSRADRYASASFNGAGAVATVNPLATRAGLEVLDQGGTALDAAVAAALTLGVVDGHNSGIGGGNFAVIHYADGRVEALDGREIAPQAAQRDMYLRGGKGDISLSTTGALAVGIPGSLAVYDYMLKKSGKFTLSDIILPAADLAERGFPLCQVSHDRIAFSAEKIRLFPATAQVLLDQQGQPWPVGHDLIQKDLANTYRMIAEQGIDYFYRGDFAHKVETWMQHNGGIINAKDFANYQMLVREPVKSSYRGYDVYGFPPPSSGGVHVAQILNVLEGFEVAKLNDGDRYHLLAEAMKLAFADRAHFLGDPDFVPVPKGLIDQTYADNLAKKIDFSAAAQQVQHGNPPGADIDLFGKHTTHISVADKLGNWVSITTTVNTSFGSKVMIPGTGVVMNNQMDDFSTQPGVPNVFGLVGSEANSVQAGKRPLSSMSPTIVVKDGQPIIAIGAAGGPTIITQVVQGLVNIIDLGMSATEALAVPRVHHQWQPEVTFIEASLPTSVKQWLLARGHKIHERGYNGASQVILLDEKGNFDAAAEPRIIQRNTVPLSAAIIH
ncbi:MAG: gamma-glutamyltransferase [Spongiibacteraceae bacterium]